MSMRNIGGANTTSNLTNIQQGDVQPNAVDLRIGKVLKISNNGFTIDEDQKLHRGATEMNVEPDGYWNLNPGAYEVVMENIVTVGEGEAGMVITRSTLNRNGVYLTTGLYDSGYEGMMAAVMHVTTGNMRIKPGTRIGQYLCFDAETLSMYDGDYGLGKAHDAKYS